VRRDTLLVVDDTPETLGFLTDTLDGAGFTVLIATDGASALELVDQITPDLVLMDAVMPGLDGFETCRRLKNEKLLTHLPVIFMTGLSETEDVVRGLAAGGIDNRSVQFIGTGVWDTPNIGSETMLRGAWYAAPDPAKRGDFERRYLATYGRPPQRLATLAYDAVALAGNLARLKQGGDFSVAAITNPSGWAGVDGVFRFLPDGRSERALAVIEIQGDRSVVVSPAPRSFARLTN